MYAVEEGRQKINGTLVETFKRSIDAPGAELEFEVGTNGFKGTACRRGGSRAYLRITKKEGDMLFEPVRDRERNVVGIELSTSGDSVLYSLLKGLGFVVQAMSDQIRGKED